MTDFVATYKDLEDFKELFLTRVVVAKGSSIYRPDAYLGNSGLIKTEIRMWLYENVGVGVDSIRDLYASKTAKWAFCFPDPSTTAWPNVWNRTEFLPIDVEFFFFDRFKAFEFKLVWA